MAEIKPTGILNHSNHSAKRSEHYHARVIGQPQPFNNSGLNVTKTRDSKTRERVKTAKAQEKMQSTRPGQTAQRGLGG
jgi:hypothetical protein